MKQKDKNMQATIAIIFEFINKLEVQQSKDIAFAILIILLLMAPSYMHGVAAIIKAIKDTSESIEKVGYLVKHATRLFLIFIPFMVLGLFFFICFY